jgi:hypothetical protein
MLDAWIIEELRRKEKEIVEQERPFLELPIDDPKKYEKKIEEEPKRGVVEIQL